MKKTKIIATIGPSSDSEKIISAMADAGMDAVRLNFSHGSYESHAKNIAAIKKIREQKKIPLPIILDTKGPEFRIKTFRKGKVALKEGDEFTFTTDETAGDEKRVSVTFCGICEHLSPGDKILLNNGLMAFEVTGIKKPDVVCKTLTGGVLSDRKSIFFPGKQPSFCEYLSEQDKADIKFGAEHGVDFIALSFVSRAQDVTDARNLLKESGSAEGDVELIAKIENRAGVDNIEEILDAADGVLIARGDLGTEIPFEELPLIQKKIIRACRIRGKTSAVATEMLESMIYNPRPTRAEISDVANAVYDGVSALTLTGETAEGAYPAEAVAAMAKIAGEAERNTAYIAHIGDAEYKIKNIPEALARSACTLAENVGAKLIIACTRTGATAKSVSRFRPAADIMGMTTDIRAYRKLALSRGVIPVMSGEFYSVDELFRYAVAAAENEGLAKKGDKIVLTGGTPDGKSGNSNLINVTEVR